MRPRTRSFCILLFPLNNQRIAHPDLNCFLSLILVAVCCCSVLHCVAVCCSCTFTRAHARYLSHLPALSPVLSRSAAAAGCVLQCFAVCCSVMQSVAVCCSVLQCVAVCRSVLQCVAVSCSRSLALSHLSPLSPLLSVCRFSCWCLDAYCEVKLDRRTCHKSLI